MPATTPTWTDKSAPYRTQRVNRFDTILGSVAEAFAHHANADYVSVSHVDDAYAALAKCKLGRTSFWRTSEFFTSLGGLLVGLAFSLTSLIGRLAPNDDTLWTFWAGAQIVVFLLLFIAGAVLWIIGWMRREFLPKKPLPKSRWTTCWPILQCPRVDESRQDIVPPVTSKKTRRVTS